MKFYSLLFYFTYTLAYAQQDRICCLGWCLGVKAVANHISRESTLTSSTTWTGSRVWCKLKGAKDISTATCTESVVLCRL